MSTKMPVDEKLVLYVLVPLILLFGIGFLFVIYSWTVYFLKKFADVCFLIWNFDFVIKTKLQNISFQNQNYIQSLERSVAYLRDRTAKLEKMNDDLRMVVADMNYSRSTLRKRITSAEDELNEMKEEIFILQEKVSSTEEDLEAMKPKINIVPTLTAIVSRDECKLGLQNLKYEIQKKDVISNAKLKDFNSRIEELISWRLETMAKSKKLLGYQYHKNDIVSLKCKMINKLTAGKMSKIAATVAIYSETKGLIYAKKVLHKPTEINVDLFGAFNDGFTSNYFLDGVSLPEVAKEVRNVLRNKFVVVVEKRNFDFACLGIDVETEPFEVFPLQSVYFTKKGDLVEPHSLRSVYYHYKGEKFPEYPKETNRAEVEAKAVLDTYNEYLKDYALNDYNYIDGRNDIERI